ncbi:MAG TPA: hypothetical protein PL110_01800 [Candidatus Eremiobacteraeota bacterium]|nr:MAG: hypothetical protein BWY64_03410 [bacterium ADurb.Bin363]HPZ06823.1 hypothetical protein [Candidatus Eremiobacteraeota bacterium]
MEGKYKMEFYLPPELATILERYISTSKKSKDEILRSALLEFFKNHPLDGWNSQNTFKEIARISKKIIAEETRE